jgi:hypothetical protein
MLGASNRRLDSWKEIAAYLGRDIRTAMRWAKERQLPVHRARGEASRSVHAFSDDIDSWLLAPARASEVWPPRAQTPLPGGRRWMAGAAGALSLLFLLAAIPHWPKVREGQLDRPPQVVRTQYPVPSPVHVAAADLDGDGHLDLIVTSADSSVRIFPGTGTGAFRQAVLLAATPGTNPFHIYTSDLNGDGRPDLVIVNSRQYEHPAEVLLNRGGFHFEHAGWIGVHPTKIAFGDFNGDGFADLAVADKQDSSLCIYLGDGKGQFRQSAHRQIEDATGFGIVTGDFNRDGKLDVAIAEYRTGTGRRVLTFFGDGRGGLGKGAGYAVGIAPLDLAIGDFNGDGIPDLATAELHGGTSILLGAGDGTFAATRQYQAGLGAGSVIATDFDGDGNSDLLLLNEHSNNASVLFGRGDGTFQPAVSLPTGVYPDGLAVADFDGDGRLDFVLAATGSNVLDVHLNRTRLARHFWDFRP